MFEGCKKVLTTQLNTQFLAKDVLGRIWRAESKTGVGFAESALVFEIITFL